VDQDTVRTSLDKHLEAIDRTVLWALAVAVVVAWAGIRKQEPIELFGMKTNRSDAYLIAGCSFVLANLALLVSIFRIGDLVQLLSDAELKKGIEKIMTHQFLSIHSHTLVRGSSHVFTAASDLGC
jgi:hypothetical protein